MNKHCMYCKLPIDTDEPGWLYAIEDDERITAAHTECAEQWDDITINEPVSWKGYDD